MRHMARLAFPMAGILALSTSTACTLDSEENEEESASIDQRLDHGLHPDLRAARRATAAYHKIERAEDDGYGDSGLPCMEGQGFHWLNPDYLGSLDPRTPAALLYAPGHRGHLRLVAVEWIVPIDDPENPPPPPTLAGHTFHGPKTIEGVPFTFYLLHAWIWSRNPDLLFADTSPDVSCEGCD